MTGASPDLGRRPRKPPLLLRSGLTGRVYIVTAYTLGEGGHVVAHTKHDVTEEFNALAGEAGESS